MDTPDIKPVVLGRARPNSYILVRLVDDDYTLNYRCQKSSTLSSLMKGFAKRRGIKDQSTMVFTHNDERVMPDQTMGELGFQIGQTKVLKFQSTMIRPKKEVKDEVKSEVKGEVKDESDSISVVFQYIDAELQFKIKRDTPFKKPMKLFCDRLGMQQHKLKFYYMGETIFAYGTPLDFDMEDGDVVDVSLQKNGGM